jgi:hypothetical protein
MIVPLRRMTGMTGAVCRMDFGSKGWMKRFKNSGSAISQACRKSRPMRNFSHRSIECERVGS